MTRGHAYGVNRKYQEHCRDFLLRTMPELVPYSGDGIDIPLKGCGTTWTMDIALKYPNGDLVVAECRRRKNASKQGEIGQFATEVECIRKELDIAVGGVFFSKKTAQLGLIKVGTHLEIKVAVLPEGEDSLSGFSIVFHRYDKQRERKLRDYLITLETGNYQVRGGQSKLAHKNKKN